MDVRVQYKVLFYQRKSLGETGSGFMMHPVYISTYLEDVWKLHGQLF